MLFCTMMATLHAKECGQYYALWKKPVAKAHMAWSHWRSRPEQANPQRQDVEWWPWLGVKEVTGETVSCQGFSGLGVCFLFLYFTMIDTRPCWAPSGALFILLFFGDRTSLNHPVWPQTPDPPVSASQAAGIPGVPGEMQIFLRPAE